MVAAAGSGPKNCDWCSGDLNAVEAPTERPAWKRTRCQSCGTISFLQPPTGQELASLYTEAWAAPQESAAIGSTDSLAAKSMIARILEKKLSDASVLDFGAGSGTFARELAQSSAASVHGFEPFGPEQVIDRVSWSSDPEGNWSARQYDLIALSEVVEHLLDPVATLVRLRELLDDDGCIFLTTPNAKGLRARIGQGSWREAQNPAHLRLFSAESLDICARRAGFAGFQRVTTPIRYKQSSAAQAILAVTQHVGLDGGLRGFLYK